MIVDSAQRSNSTFSTASHATSAELNNSGGFPSLFSEEEFDEVKLQRNQCERPEHDRWDNAGVRAKPAPTDGLPESTIEQRFTHVTQQLVAMWPSEACALYLKRLVISDRGMRQGFPQDVIEDLMMLYQINEMLCGAISQKSRSHAATSPRIDVAKAVFDWNAVADKGYRYT